MWDKRSKAESCDALVPSHLTREAQHIIINDDAQIDDSWCLISKWAFYETKRSSVTASSLIWKNRRTWGWIESGWERWINNRFPPRLFFPPLFLQLFIMYFFSSRVLFFPHESRWVLRWSSHAPSSRESFTSNHPSSPFFTPSCNLSFSLSCCVYTRLSFCPTSDASCFFFRLSNLWD